MAIQIEEINATNCKTYLLTAGKTAILVDPVRERVETYRSLLSARQLELSMILETHTHADHLSFSRAMLDSFGVPHAMHVSSPSPLVGRHLEHGEVIMLGDGRIEVYHTPGHTPDSLCFVMDGAVLAGDTLLIGGSGRCDFPGGDAGAQYDAIKSLLFALPDETFVWPGHDYNGRTSTTIGEQKRTNPRLATTTRSEYVAIMDNLGLPFPERVQQALQTNQSGLECDEVTFPSVADVAAAPAISALEVAELLAGDAPPLLLDCREPEEFVGELGHIKGSLLIPLDMLQRRLPKLVGYHEHDIVVVCRAGLRSGSACAILKQAGFRRVKNLTRGMLAWNEAGLPTQQ